MVLKFELTNDWAIVPIALLGSFVSMVYLSAAVGQARKRHGVAYPKMYASVVTDKNGELLTDAKSPEDAEAFNCCQRGHQNSLETHYSIMVLTLVPSFFFPKASALTLVVWTIGALSFGIQYRSGGPKSRNKGLAVAKYVGMISLLALNLLTAYTVYTA